MIKLIGDYTLDANYGKFIVNKGWKQVAEVDDLKEALQATTDDIIKETVAGNVSFTKEDVEEYTKIVDDLITMYNHCYELFKGIAEGGKQNG